MRVLVWTIRSLEIHIHILKVSRYRSRAKSIICHQTWIMGKSVTVVSLIVRGLGNASDKQTP